MAVTGKQSKLTLGLDDYPGHRRNILYGLQWLGFVMAQTAVVPVVIGPVIGLDSTGIAALAQRLFFLTGLASLLQVYVGHRLPITEGPSALSWAVLISLAQVGTALGHSLTSIRTDFAGGLLAAGIMLFLLGITGVLGKMMKLFTPAVTGCMMILLSLQLSRVFLRSMLGITAQHPLISLPSLAVSVAVIATVLFVSLRGGSFMRSVSVLVGLLIGWAIHASFGLGSMPAMVDVPLVDYPRAFAWGWPTFGLGIVTTNVLIGCVLVANTIASVSAMVNTLQAKAKQEAGTYDKATMVNGAANILAGCGSVVGFVPYAAAAGLVSISGVASRAPFVLCCLILMGFGFFPYLGMLVAAIPEPVGYAVFMTVFAQIFMIGIKDLIRLPLDLRDSFVVGLTVLLSVGIMALPFSALAGLPQVVQFIVGSGLVSGILICLLLEHVALPRDKVR